MNYNNSDEWFPIVNEDGIEISRALRSVCHDGKSKLLHPVVHMHLFNIKGELFLQKRSMTKDLLPGYWDTSVGGHVSPGESPEVALGRETFEELGLKDFSYKFIRKYIWESAREKELVYSFTGSSEIYPVINKDEIEEGRFWSIEEIEKSLDKSIFTSNFKHEFNMILTMDPIISIRNLNKYYGVKKVLSDISIDINPGQIIGYIGPNGAGKSTTVKILCGLISDFTGEVIIRGINVKKDPVGVKRLIGYIPEMAELYDVLTPMEFLRFMGALYNLADRVSTERAENMLEAFGLVGNKNQRMDTFSKGMKQKVLIISGLLHNPEILILDEPLNGLDANSVIIVKDLLNKMASKGKTIFYCSHMMDIVEKVSDRIILINEGKVVADGTFDELKLKEGDNTLEKIFAHLTADESLSGASDKLMNAFGNNSGN